MPLENHQLPLASPQLLHHASHARKDRLAHPDLLDHLESPERLDLLDAQEQTLPTESLDLGDHLARPESLDHRDHPASLECLPPPNHQFPESLETKETRDLLAHPDPLDRPEPTDPLAHLDQRESLDQMEPLEPMDSPDPLDLLDQLEPPERRVSARNTALPTEECSSRTELGVKRYELDTAEPGIVLAVLLLLLVAVPQCSDWLRSSTANNLLSSTHTFLHSPADAIAGPFPPPLFHSAAPYFYHRPFVVPFCSTFQCQNIQKI